MPVLQDEQQITSSPGSQEYYEYEDVRRLEASLKYFTGLIEEDEDELRRKLARVDAVLNDPSKTADEKLDAVAKEFGDDEQEEASSKPVMLDLKSDLKLTFKKCFLTRVPEFNSEQKSVVEEEAARLSEKYLNGKKLEIVEVKDVNGNKFYATVGISYRHMRAIGKKELAEQALELKAIAAEMNKTETQDNATPLEGTDITFQNAKVTSSQHPEITGSGRENNGAVPGIKNGVPGRRFS